MARIVIKCFPGPGFDGVWAAKRKWPASGVTVETVDGDVDVEGSDGGYLKVCPATIKELEETGRFSFGLAGSLQELEALKARVVELEAENAALKAAAGGSVTPIVPPGDTKDAPGKRGK